MISKRFFNGFIVFVIFLSLPLAWAGGPKINPKSPWYRSDRPERWHLEFFLGGAVEPDYPGSDNYEVEPEANVRFIYKDPWQNRYLLSIAEVEAQIDLTDATVLDLRIEYEEGREDDNDALDGLGDQDDTLEGHLGLFHRFGDLSVGAVFQPELIDKGKGLVFFVGAAYDQLLMNDRLRLSPHLDVSWADTEHMKTEFGISEEEATRSEFEAYKPSGGLKSTTGGLDLEYRFNQKWSLLAEGEVEYYFDEAADSPLIDDAGSRTTFEVTLGLFYRFR